MSRFYLIIFKLLDERGVFIDEKYDIKRGNGIGAY